MGALVYLQQSYGSAVCSYIVYPHRLSKLLVLNFSFVLVPSADQSTGTGSFISRKQSIEDYGMFLCYTLNEQEHNRCLTSRKFFWV